MFWLLPQVADMEKLITLEPFSWRNISPDIVQAQLNKLIIVVIIYLSMTHLSFGPSHSSISSIFRLPRYSMAPNNCCDTRIGENQYNKRDNILKNHQHRGVHRSVVCANWRIVLRANVPENFKYFIKGLNLFYDRLQNVLCKGNCGI